MIKSLMLLCALIFVLGTAGVGAAVPEPEKETPEDVDFSVLPSEAGKLRYLDERQRQLIQRTVRRCLGTGSEFPPADLAKNPCIRRGVEKELARADDPKLKAFHYAVPEGARYNAIRKDMEWQPAVKSRIAQTKPLDWEPPE